MLCGFISIIKIQALKHVGDAGVLDDTTVAN